LLIRLSNFIIIAVSLVLGILLRKSKLLPDRTLHYLNRYVIWIALPATIFATVPLITISSDLLLPAAMPWMLFFLGAAFFVLLRDRLGFSKGTLGALILTGSLGNTSFVGFPMLIALMGQDALGTAIVIDQAGSFLVVSTLGLITASVLSNHDASWKKIVMRVILFPPFIALIIAFCVRPLLTNQAGFMAFYYLTRYVLSPLMWTLGPAALLAVGYQLQFNRRLLKARRRELSVGLLLKLVLAPIAIVFICSATPLSGYDKLVTTLEAAMPPMITAAIIANEHGLDQELTALMVGIGIPLSIITVPLWFWILS
jgi:malate permease and related proteins